MIHQKVSQDTRDPEGAKHKITLLPENISLKDHFLILLGKSRLGGEATLGSIQLRPYFKAQSSVKESARGLLLF